MSFFQGLFNRGRFGQNGGQQNAPQGFGQQSPMQRQLQARAQMPMQGNFGGHLQNHAPQQAHMPRQAPPYTHIPQQIQPQVAPHMQMPTQQPYHDPSVRFEPYDATAGQGQPQPVTTSKHATAGDESRAIAFYKSLANADDATAYEKEKIEEMLASKKIESYTLEEPPHIAHFQDGLRFALSQESMLVRNAKAGETLAQKVADIALLVSLIK